MTSEERGVNEGPRDTGRDRPGGHQDTREDGRWNKGRDDGDPETWKPKKTDLRLRKDEKEKEKF